VKPESLRHLRDLLLIGVALIGAMAVADSVSTRPLRPSERPATWATKLSKPGLPNLHRVSEGLYRGAQPTAAGMAQLEKMGIKTVINLRASHSDEDRLKSTDLDQERFPMKPWHAKDEDVIYFLKIVTATNRLPVFVHCQRGADRTGLMCAMYRVAVQDWSKEEAIREMTRGGYGFHSEWKNLIRYVETADVAELRRQAGIAQK